MLRNPHAEKFSYNIVNFVKGEKSKSKYTSRFLASQNNVSDSD